MCIRDSRHVLAQICWRFFDAQFNLYRAACGIHAGVDVGDFGSKTLLREGIGGTQCDLSDGKFAEVFFVDLHFDLGFALRCPCLLYTSRFV